MKKLTKGTRVETTHGGGIVVGYDMENHDCWRHIVKLDSGKLWNGKNPAFFSCDIKPIKNDVYTYRTTAIYAQVLKNGEVIKSLPYNREEHSDNLYIVKNLAYAYNNKLAEPPQPEN